MGPHEKNPTNWRAWITGILIALVVVVCLQNSQKVSVEETDAIFAHLKEVREQAHNDPEVLEISMDTKAKVSLVLQR